MLTSKLLFIVFSSRSIHLYARPDLECTLGAARRCMFSPEICRMCPHRARARRCLFSKTGTLTKRGVENDDASPSRKEVGLNSMMVNTMALAGYPFYTMQKQFLSQTLYGTCQWDVFNPQKPLSPLKYTAS